MPFSPLAVVLMEAARQQGCFHEQVHLRLHVIHDPLKRLQFSLDGLGGVGVGPGSLAGQGYFLGGPFGSGTATAVGLHHPPADPPRAVKVPALTSLLPCHRS